VQHRVKGGVESAGPDLGLEPLAESGDQRDVQLVLQVVQHALDVLTDDAGDAGGRDEDRLRLVALIGLQNRVAQLFRAAEYRVPLVQVRADDAQVGVVEPAHARPGLEVHVAGHRVGRAANRRMVDDDGVLDAAELPLAAPRGAGARLGEAALAVPHVAAGGPVVQIPDGADVTGDGTEPELPDRHLVLLDVDRAHNYSFYLCRLSRVRLGLCTVL
jgi:hypothetical protein